MWCLHSKKRVVNIMNTDYRKEHRSEFRRMENLKLERPIIFIDVETTGLNTSYDRIIELTVLKIYPEGTEEQKSVRFNPEVPIPPAATKVHGITDENVAHDPPFRKYAKNLMAYLDGCDLAGFGLIRFDIPILSAEFKRVGLELDMEGCRVLDPLFIYHRFEPRDLAAAYRTYCGKELEEAHTSAADVRASIEILDAQLGIHPELPKEMNDLHDFCHPKEPDWIDDDGRLILTDQGPALGFGKYRGLLLSEVVGLDPDYLDWIVDSDFSRQVKDVVVEARFNRLNLEEAPAPE